MQQKVAEISTIHQNTIILQRQPDRIGDQGKDTRPKIFCFVLFCLFRATLQQTEVPRRGVTSELWPLAYTTATAAPDPSHVCHLHISWQRRILNPLSEARHRACVLVDASQIRFCWAVVGTPMPRFQWDPTSFPGGILPLRGGHASLWASVCTHTCVQTCVCVRMCAHMESGVKDPMLGTSIIFPFMVLRHIIQAWK